LSRCPGSRPRKAYIFSCNAGWRVRPPNGTFEKETETVVMVSKKAGAGAVLPDGKYYVQVRECGKCLSERRGTAFFNLKTAEAEVARSIDAMLRGDT
jgi:hypothetical protein